VKNIALDYSIPIFQEQAEYRLRVRSTENIGYVAVMWIADSYDFMSIQDIGSYRDPADASNPVPWMRFGRAVGINITVDFTGSRGRQ